jgi:CheY-like chemotaxis protein
MDAAQGPLVLVVDDDARSRELMGLILRHAGYRVLAAPDATTAVALLQVERPAAALVDLLMPGMNGLDFCRWLRTQPGLAAIGFMLLTGMDTDETRRDASEAGVDLVLTKPFDRLDLLAKLSTLVVPA